MRNIKKKVVYGKVGSEGDIWFLKGAIENLLREEKELKLKLKECQESRKLYEKKIEEIRQRPKVVKKQNSD